MKITTGLQYGSVFKNRKGWQLTASNPIDTKLRCIGTYGTETEAYASLNEYNFKFYSEFPNLLPKCISLNRKQKCFVFNLSLRGKTIWVSNHKSLQNACNAKAEFITKMF